VTRRVIAGTRVAVIGAGLGAAAHLRALREMDCPVVAVATRDPGRAAAVRDLLPGTPICWPASEALDAGPTLAIVASPAGTHLDVVREAADRGIHVLVEKPLDARLDRAEEIVAVTRARGVGLAVCLQHRAKPAGRALRSLVGGGGLGRITGGAVSVPWWRPPSYYDEPGRGTYARDGGGVLINQAIHPLDLFIAAVGAPTRVYARATRTLHRLEAEDTVSAVLDYAGWLAPVHATTAAFPGRDEELWVSGTAGTVVLRGAELIRFDGSGADPTTLVADPGGASTAADPAGMPTAFHRALIEDAVEAFATGREPIAGGPSALITQRVVAAAYRSARLGEWVRPDDPVLVQDRPA
jgi:UDP-N-acetyl-2-amino-2-deoxyglucuronate dehydrogenase